MLDLDQLQTIGQIIENIEILTERLEKAFESSNGEEFLKAKKEISILNDKINQMVNQK